MGRRLMRGRLAPRPKIHRELSLHASLYAAGSFETRSDVTKTFRCSSKSGITEIQLFRLPWEGVDIVKEQGMANGTLSVVDLNAELAKS